MRVAIQSYQDRSIEWFSAAVMLGWGVILAHGNLLDEPGFIAFKERLDSDGFWIAVFCIVGAGRLMALYINGRWPRTPIIRMIGSSVGTAMWAVVAYFLLKAAWINDKPISTGPVVYGLLAACDLYQVSRAAFDARYHR